MIGKSISELLFTHECVIVPGLGGFLTSYAHAQIHPVTNRLSPPYKKIAFNASLKGNDGLLVNHIAQQNRTSFHDAAIMVTEWVETGLKTMSSGGNIFIENVGTLRYNNEGNIQFNRSGTLNYLEESYGLPTYVTHPLVTIKQVTQAKTEVETPETVHKAGSLRHIVTATAKWAAVLAPFIALTLWGTSNHIMIGSLARNYTGMFAWSNTTPGKTATIAVRPGLVKPAVYVAPSPEIYILETNPGYEPCRISHQSINTESITAGKSILPNQLVIASSPDIPSHVYHVITGAFKSKSNADKLVSELTSLGYPASIIGTTRQGLMMVGIKGFKDKQQALAIQSKLNNLGFQSAWLLKE
jgi:hypothetical protein